MNRLFCDAALAAAVTLSAGAAHAACDPAQYIAQCVGILDNGYTIVNTYAFDNETIKEGKIVDDNVLTTRLSYQVAVCSPEGHPVEFSLETASGDRVTTNKEGDALQSVFMFKPERMTVYNLIFKAQPSDGFCGGRGAGDEAVLKHRCGGSDSGLPQLPASLPFTRGPDPPPGQAPAIWGAA